MSRELTPAALRSVLIATLRDRQLWPPDFQWDFSSCTTCAMGMLMELMQRPNLVYMVEHEKETAKLLGLDDDDVTRIFATPVWRVPDLASDSQRHASWDAVTPEMVAKRLELVHQRLATAPLP